MTGWNVIRPFTRQPQHFHHTAGEGGPLDHWHWSGGTWIFSFSFSFFSKKTPPWPIFVFENTRDLKNIFFKNRLESFFYQSHWIAFGITIPKWYNTWVSKIFFVNKFFKNIFKKIFKNIFPKKNLKNIFDTQVLYHFGIVRPNAIQWL